MQRVIRVDDSYSFSDIVGVEDKNLKFLEKELKVSLAVIPDGISIEGNKKAVNAAVDFVQKIIDLSREGFRLNPEEISHYLKPSCPDERNIALAALNSADSPKLGIKVSSGNRRVVLPRTKRQGEYIQAMRQHDIVFSLGPAGTGKTYLAMAMAVNSLIDKQVRRIILARPAIEAGESLGFLPGDMHDKLGPYLRPLYDALYDMLETAVIENYLEAGIIEILPLAYMRGRTLNNAFVILDEAQNCTSEQLKMFLTRLGFDSKAVITGDTTQSDLPGGKPTGLIEAVNLLKAIKGIEFINLDKKDVVRHPLIQKIIQAYENFYSQKAN